MRILRVITRLNVGGPARHVGVLHRGLAARGHECLLVAGDVEADEGDYAAWDDMGAERLPGLRRSASPLEIGRAITALRSTIRRFAPDVIHTHTAMAGFVGRVAAGRVAAGGRATLVHTFHGHVLDGYFSPARARLFRIAERTLARRTDALVAVSGAVRDELLALRVGRPERWHVVPLGLHLDDLLRVDATLPRTRTVGIVGRLVPIKDHETAFRALAKVPDVRVVVAGDGELRGQLEVLARELGLQVDFRGWVRDLPPLYAELDLVLLTSRNEGTPVALIEAMAAGRPVVATAVGGVPDVVDQVLARPGGVNGIAAAVAPVLDAPKAPDRDAIARRYDARRLIADVDELYSGLIAQASR